MRVLTLWQQHVLEHATIQIIIWIVKPYGLLRQLSVVSRNQLHLTSGCNILYDLSFQIYASRLNILCGLFLKSHNQTLPYVAEKVLNAGLLFLLFFLLSSFSFLGRLITWERVAPGETFQLVGQKIDCLQSSFGFHSLALHDQEQIMPCQKLEALD